MTTGWQKRRSEFNHDWLKNHYLIALGAWLNLLDGELQDVERERRFVPQILAQWEWAEREALELARGFAQEMSPQGLFDRPPLARCDVETRAWLGPLVHALWQSRYDVPKLTAEAMEQVERAGAAYRRLREALAGCADVTSAAALRPLRAQFAEFCDCCQSLARAIEQFPSEIKVV